MITPAGKECSYFYGDYFRGREQESCRLLESASLEWTPDLCEKCPVPDIQMANACEFQNLYPKLAKPVFFMKAQVEVSAYCTKCTCSVDEPRVGCGQCHPLPQIFFSDSE